MAASDDQSAMDAFVHKEIHFNTSSLVDAVVTHVLTTGEDFGPISHDDLLTALCPSLYSISQNELDELAYDYDADELVDAIEACGFDEEWDLLDPEDKAAVLEHLNVEPPQKEVFQWFTVSEWLGRKLREHGEIVLDDNIWGRTCFGQAISGDRVICNIYDELHPMLLSLEKAPK